MTQMKDTEGGDMPVGHFDIDLCDWGDGLGPKLSLNIPLDIEGYTGAGVLTASLKDVLSEYLEFPPDGLENAKEFAEYLRCYADSLDKEVNKIETE